MDRRNVERLAEFCLDGLDDEVRAVGAVRGDTVEAVYTRDDLRSRYTDAQLEGLEDAAVRTAGALGDLNTFDSSLGQSRAGMFVFEDAFLLVIPGRDDTAACVSLDRTVSQDLSAFIKQCTNELFSAGTAPSGSTATDGAGPAADDSGS